MISERILIIDDNKEFAEELRDILYSSGYDVVSINDSGTAVSAARRFIPDVILLDLRMHSMNGFEVAAQLKRFPLTKDIPIIAMSGYFPVEKGSGIMDLSNMHSSIKKPFSVTELITHIENALSLPIARI